MSESERVESLQDPAMSQEFASAVNLLAHPVAGAAAIGALGMGMAGHVAGLWLGAWAEAFEATQKFGGAAVRQASAGAQADVISLVRHRAEQAKRRSGKTAKSADGRTGKGR